MRGQTFAFAEIVVTDEPLGVGLLPRKNRLNHRLMLTDDLVDGRQKRIGGRNHQPHLLLNEPILRGKPLMT